MTFEQAVAAIDSARRPTDLFAADSDEAKRQYRNLVKLCHPDTATPANKSAAERVFAKLAQLYDTLTGKPTAATVSTMVGKWEVVGPLAKGGLTDLHLVRYDTNNALLKIARSPTDNKLLATEAKSLKHLADDANFGRYIPKLLDSFEASGRRANITTFDDSVMPLSTIRSRLPNGVPFRHVVWMMNRLWSALGYAHTKNVIHGAVLPNHLLYRLNDHGLQLIDWTASVRFPDDHGHIPYASRAYRTFYPPEVFKKDAYPTTDIYMAARCAIYAADSIPARFRRLLEWCTAESPFARPDNAWDVLDRWKTIAEQEFGKPSFVELTLPAN